MATHFSILAWDTPWTEEPGRLYSPWGHERVRHELVTKECNAKRSHLQIPAPLGVRIVTYLAYEINMLPFEFSILTYE